VSSKTFVVVIMVLAALIVFLFVSAPPPLPEQAMQDANIPVEMALQLVEAENDVVRGLWTKEIVGAGQQLGLEFNEDWREADEQAGPLPALFLRETARNLERDPVRLSLFLGSDSPINPANGFEGLQEEYFKQIRETGEPQFFLMSDTGLYTAMFPDEALVEGCVSCHNEHEDSPKTDWQLHDVMGATTWAYPNTRLTSREMTALLVALRTAFRGAYQAYLDKVVEFDNPPQIGARWPAEGYYLPSTGVFMDEVARRTSQASLEALLNAATLPPTAVSDAAPDTSVEQIR
jgi:adenylate cyclase